MPVECHGNDAGTARNETTTAGQQPMDVCRTEHLRRIVDLRQFMKYTQTVVMPRISAVVNALKN